ncbi:MAG: ABC transporter ATP-binding protein [Candidatus Eremiobacterota bacterium]
MIEVIDVTKKYKTITALNNISFKVEKGEIFGFLGPNGAGKTTTLRILTGQIKPTSGKASVCNYDIIKDRKKLKENIGVVFEHQNLYHRLSGINNLELFRRLYRVSQKRVYEVLDIVELSHRAKESVQHYSRGMKQRLLIARALLHKPSVMFLDEPSSGLDPHSAHQIRNMILNLSKEGVTVFLTTHYLEEAELLCNRVAIIDRGTIIALDRTESLKSLYSSRTVNVKIEENGNARVISLPVDCNDTGDKIKEFFNSKILLSIHSEEPKLEEVFLRITNRGNL